MQNKLSYLFNTLINRLYLLFSTKKSRRKQWPPVRKLSHIHIQNCRLLEDRVRILDEIPVNGVVAEIGIWKCDFSRKILRTTKPSLLHLVDISSESIEMAKQIFRQEVET